MILKEKLNPISLFLVTSWEQKLMSEETELMIQSDNCKWLNAFLGATESEIVVHEDDGVTAADHFQLGAAMAHFYLRQLFPDLSFDVDGYIDVSTALESAGESVIDRLWKEMDWFAPDLKQEIGWVAKRGGFFDDFFVEGALVVLGSYFVKPNSGFGELAQPDLVEN